jgi:hypothetical protein
MKRGSTPSEARAGATTLAVTAATVALLEVLQQTTGAFNPQPAISVLIVTSVFFATLALTVLRQRTERDQYLDGALRCWPLPRMEAADAYRLGVFPPRRDDSGPGASDYVPRGQIDDNLKAALPTSDLAVVVVLGPPRAGKSRTAFEATSSALSDALVVAPRNSGGLRSILELDPPLFSRRSRSPKWSGSARAVLWLDGLTRYLKEIDANMLDHLRTSTIPVTVVATIREEEYDAALEGSGAETEAAKAIVGAGRGFRLPADGLGAGLASDGREVEPPAETTGPSDPLDAKSAQAPTRDALFAGPAVLCLASLAAILIVSLTAGFSKSTPPSVSEQADDALRGAGGEVVWGPETADLHGSGQDSVLFVFSPASGDDSPPPSEEVRIYDQRGDRLLERFRFRPSVDGAEFQFRALGELGGAGTKLVGGYGFPNEASFALVPFVIRWDSANGEYVIDGLQDEPPTLSEGVKPEPSARPYLRAYRQRVNLRDSESNRALNGYRVQDFAVQGDPDRLISALAVKPMADGEPGVVEVQGSILSLSGPDPTLVKCRFNEARPLLGTWSPGSLLQFEVLDPWKPFIEDRICEPDL